MAEARAVPSLGGFDEEFVNAVEDELQCAICQLPLKDPMLTKCGHRFCRQCLDEHFRRLEIDRQQSCCPVDRNKLIQAKDIFPDKATERKILSLIIKCPSNGCQWTGELRSKENHLASCPVTIIACPYAHMGCEIKIQRREVESHLETTTRLHLDLACVKLSDTQEEFKETTRNHEEKFKETTRKLEKMFKETTRKLEERVNNLEKIIKCSEEQNYCKWKISGFSEVLRKAKNEEKTMIFSEPFHRYGYKFRLHLLPNGFDCGKNTHLTIGINIMKGKHDDILPWPFHKKVTFTLIDQQEDADERKNIKISLKDPEEQMYFAKPVTYENTGLGLFTFVSHKTLQERRYIVDDTIIIQVQVSPPP